eukprot:sb/3473184/
MAVDGKRMPLGCRVSTVLQQRRVCGRISTLKLFHHSDVSRGEIRSADRGILPYLRTTEIRTVLYPSSRHVFNLTWIIVGESGYHPGCGFGSGRTRKGCQSIGLTQFSRELWSEHWPDRGKFSHPLPSRFNTRWTAPSSNNPAMSLEGWILSEDQT